MAKFTVRIELRDSSSADYDKLHERMEAKGFSRTITTSLGNTYRLPNAEYIYIQARMKTKNLLLTLLNQWPQKLRKIPVFLLPNLMGAM